MNVRQVVRFIERIDPRLPIRLPLASGVAHHAHLVQLVALEIPLGQTHPFLQRRGRSIHIDEDHARQDLASDFSQSRTMCDQFRVEGFLVDYSLQLAVAADRPPLAPARDAARAAPVDLAYSIASMRAGIEEGLDGVIRLV